MKQVLTYIKLAAISLLLLSACTQDETFFQAGDSTSADDDLFAIKNVRIADFNSDSSTRTINDGNKITFEYEDQMGLLLLNTNGELIKNISFKYTEVEGADSWTNVENANYTNKIAKVIAYFPYTEKANAAKSVEDLKVLIELQANQSKPKDFKAMDLLVDEISEITSATLEIRLSHVYSLLSFSAKSTLKAGDETFDYFVELTDVAFAIDNKSYTPCRLGGEYVCLLEPTTRLGIGTFRYFYTTGDNTYVKTLKAEKTLDKNFRYTFPCEAAETSIDVVSPGDFYCTTPRGTATILPGSAAAVPVGLTCHGIVFHTMDKEAVQAFVTDNQIPNVTIADDDTPHGLVVSLKYGNRLLDASIGDNNKTEITDLLSGISHDQMLGYLLSKKLKEKYQDLFPALSNHTVPVAGSITEWYGPSIKEMFVMGRGGDGSVPSNAGILLLNKQMLTYQGEALIGNIPSVSFEANAGFKILETAAGTELGWKGFPGELIRPVFAF